jgi:large subunit ribosomal protein L7/L12
MAEAQTLDSQVVALGDQIAALTLKQAVELAKYLKEKHGIEPAAPATVVAAPAAGAAAPPPVEEKTIFDVVLKAAGEKKIQVIKAVRALTSLGLKEAKELVEGAPKPVKQGISKQEAQDAVKQLTEAGGTAEMA